MDEIIDRRFERVEKALATLINSISTYNPAPALANDLVAADAELSQGLEQLSQHQSNHAKIVALRATSQELDNQIRDILILLTTTRAELLSTPSTTLPPATNPIAYSELLTYARRISKTTLPYNYRPPVAQGSPETGEAAANTPKESKSETHTNGAGTPAVATNGVDRDAHITVTALDVDGATPSGDLALQNQLPEDPNELFIPWPMEDVIRRGALGSIQFLIDQGIDPATFDPERSAELEAERKRIMEEEDRVKEEQRLQMEEQKRIEMERRMSVSGSVPNVRKDEKPAVFQLDNFEDEED